MKQALFLTVLFICINNIYFVEVNKCSASIETQRKVFTKYLHHSKKRGEEKANECALFSALRKKKG